MLPTLAPTKLRPRPSSDHSDGQHAILLSSRFSPDDRADWPGKCIKNLGFEVYHLPPDGLQNGFKTKLLLLKMKIELCQMDQFAIVSSVR